VGVSFLAKLLSHLVTFIKLSGEPIEFEREGLVLREEDVKLHALKGVASR